MTECSKALDFVKNKIRRFDAASAANEAVARTAPDQLEPILRNMAMAVGWLSPDVMLEMLSQRSTAGAEGQRVVGEVVRRMSDPTIGWPPNYRLPRTDRRGSPPLRRPDGRPTS